MLIRKYTASIIRKIKMTRNSEYFLFFMALEIRPIMTASIASPKIRVIMAHTKLFMR